MAELLAQHSGSALACWKSLMPVTCLMKIKHKMCKEKVSITVLRSRTMVFLCILDIRLEQCENENQARKKPDQICEI